jgi:hypothetical protein
VAGARQRYARPTRKKILASFASNSPTRRTPGIENLVEISWDEFFKKFDEANLALVYEEETASGQRSNFNKLVGSETAAARERGESHASRRHGKR